MSKYIKTYRSFFESVSQGEIDEILDKIGEFGIESLTDREKSILAKSKEGIDKRNTDKIEIDSDGDFSIDGEKINKREPITEWSRELKEEIEEYLFKNFRRSGKNIYDNLEIEISLEEAIRRVKRFFNCNLEELVNVVKNWNSKGMSLTENSKQFDFLEIDKKILSMCEELSAIEKELCENEEPDQLPEYLQSYVSLLEIKGYDGWEYTIGNDIVMFVNELSNEEKLKIARWYREFKSEYKDFPSLDEMKDIFQSIIDDWDVGIAYEKIYEDVRYNWIIKIDGPEFIDTSNAEYDVIDTKKYLIFLNEIEHIKENLTRLNFTFRYDKIDGNFKILVSLK